MWVPIVVAALGFIGVVTAQLIAGWREDRRWRREQQREDQRWQRERQRDGEQRRYEGRAAGYAEVIGAIESFDFVLYQAMRVRERGERLEEQLQQDLRASSAQLRASLGPVNLHAPEKVRTMLPGATLPRSRLCSALLAGVQPERHRELWREGQLGYRRMRAEMRGDLGLDAEDIEAVEAAIRPGP